MAWHVNLLTLFPDMFPGYLGQSLAGRALERGGWSLNAVQIRAFATDKHATVDDTPFGGGAGMVMRPDVIESALLSLLKSSPPRGEDLGEREIFAQVVPPPHPGPLPVGAREDGIGRKIYMSPRGRVLNQALAKELSAEPTLTILCGRYEGVDQRVLDAHGFEEISIGDYVLSGGEVAALTLMDACIRLLPGVMGNEATADGESFGSETGGLLEYPHYTRPAEWVARDGKTHAVPEILRSGDHARVEKWRKDQSLAITALRRPDLLPKK